MTPAARTRPTGARLSESVGRVYRPSPRFRDLSSACDAVWSVWREPCGQRGFPWKLGVSSRPLTPFSTPPEYRFRTLPCQGKDREFEARLRSEASRTSWEFGLALSQRAVRAVALVPKLLIHNAVPVPHRKGSWPLFPHIYPADGGRMAP
jgi:hypothetical protein